LNDDADDDADDELEDSTWRGKSTNDSHPVSRIEERFNLLLLSIGGEVEARCPLLEAAGVMKDSGGNTMM